MKSVWSLFFILLLSTTALMAVTSCSEMGEQKHNKPLPVHEHPDHIETPVFAAAEQGIYPLACYPSSLQFGEMEYYPQNACLSPRNIVAHLGFRWKRLDKKKEPILIKFTVPRRHTTEGYGKPLWWFAPFKAAYGGLIYAVESNKDRDGNMWIEVTGEMSHFYYFYAVLGQIFSHDSISPDFETPFPEWDEEWDNYPRSLTEALLPGEHIDSEDEEIKQLARELSRIDELGNSPSMWDVVYNIATSRFFRNMPYDYENLNMVLNGYTCTNWRNHLDDATKVLDRYKGVCATKSRLLAAMLRSLMIPARIVSMAGLHLWVEAWINGIGWVPVDVTANLNHPFPKYPFRDAENIITHVGGRDDELFFSWIPQVQSRFSMVRKNFNYRKLIIDSDGIVVRPSDFRLELNHHSSRSAIHLGTTSLYFLQSDESVYAVTFVRSTREVIDMQVVAFDEINSIMLKNKELTFYAEDIENNLLLIKLERSVRPQTRSRRHRQQP